MQEFGGAEFSAPSEGGSNATEQASEQAAQQFAASQAAMQQIRREEQKAKRSDDGVVQAIVAFLTDSQRAHLSVLIARLVARDCPSSFILAILSLINPECLAAVQEHLKDRLALTAEEVNASQALAQTGQLDAESNRQLLDWITRLQMVLGVDPQGILASLKTDDANIDGTVLQLTTFVLQEFFRDAQKKDVPFEKVHPLAAGILQSVFGPYF